MALGTLPATGARLAHRLGRTGLVLGAIVLGLGATRTHHFPADVQSVDEFSTTAPADWCATGTEALPGDGCYAAGGENLKPLPLVVYLHGMFEKGTMEDEERDRQRRIAHEAVERGFAFLALRARPGGCMKDPRGSSLVCWPSNEWTAERAPAFVKSWRPALEAAAKRHPFTRKFLLGFSSGGYFAGLVAEQNLWDADACVVAHAGPVEPVKAVGSKPPLLLISAADDPSRESMRRYDDELFADEWPHDRFVREGGHSLADVDIDVALTFFVRSQKEPLPLRPTLPAHGSSE
jgi:predicted esterase